MAILKKFFSHVSVLDCLWFEFLFSWVRDEESLLTTVSIYSFKFDYFTSCESSEALIFQWILIFERSMDRFGIFNFWKAFNSLHFSCDLELTWYSMRTSMCLVFGLIKMSFWYPGKQEISYDFLKGNKTNYFREMDKKKALTNSTRLTPDQSS